MRTVSRSLDAPLHPGARPAGRSRTCLGAIVMAQLRHAEGALEALRAGQAGQLRLAAFATAGASLVPRALARFKEVYPGVDLDLTMAESDEALAACAPGTSISPLSLSRAR